ncbi:MAG: hypothetical protein WA890_16835 [Micromonospora sp.]
MTYFIATLLVGARFVAVRRTTSREIDSSTQEIWICPRSDREPVQRAIERVKARGSPAGRGGGLGDTRTAPFPPVIQTIPSRMTARIYAALGYRPVADMANLVIVR